jgi:uncharacterized membrane protein YebE (DUF533 family)
VVQLIPLECRTLIYLWCRVAWVDSVITDEERAYVYWLFSHMGAGAVTPEELQAWLEREPPPLAKEQLAVLSEDAAEVFWQHASAVAAADGHADRDEMAMIHRTMNKIFEED